MRKNLLAFAILVLLVTVVAAGCQGIPAPVETPREETPEPTGAIPGDPKEEATVIPTPTPEGNPPQLSAGAQRAVDLARQDLAQRLGRQMDTVRLVSVESVRWPDASLGCPQPDEMYAQVVTPGFRIMLRAAGQVHTYHADQEGRVILCREESASSEDTPSDRVEPGLENLANQAREDLASRLSLPVEQIEVLEAESVVWPDGGLGCPEPGMAYIQVQQEGVRIRLQAGGRVYSYHGGPGRPLFLCEQATTDAPPGQ